MKLLFITNIPTPYNNDLFNSLAERVDLTVYFYAKIESDRQWDINVSSDKYLVRIFRDNFFSSVLRRKFPGFYFSIDIWSYLSGQTDVVIVSGNYYAPNSLAAIFIFKIRGKKVFWFGEKLYKSGKAKTFLKKILFMPINFMADGLFAVGQSGVDSYKKIGFKGNVNKINYAIDNEKFRADMYPMQSSIVPNKFKLIILTSGSLINRKGIDLAVRAYQGLEDRYQKLSELWIIGDGPEKSNLMAMAGNHEGIRFFGFIQPLHLPRFFSKASLFIFPTRYDGWGVVVNEALAFGLPVIVSDAAASSELIIDGYNGYVCKSNHVSEYITAMEKIISNPELFEGMRHNASKSASMIDSSVVADTIVNRIS